MKKLLMVLVSIFLTTLLSVNIFSNIVEADELKEPTAEETNEIIEETKESAEEIKESVEEPTEEIKEVKEETNEPIKEVAAPIIETLAPPTTETNAPIDDCITFSSSDSFSLQTSSGNKGWNDVLYYSFDKIEWTEWDGSIIDVTNSIDSLTYKLYLRGSINNNKISDENNYWVLTPSNTNTITCEGNIETLRGATDSDPSSTPMESYCYSYLFKNCASLTKAPDLPATILSQHCYEFMFRGCESLTTLPALPATTLADYCYYHMFSYCTSLTTLPNNLLPATTLAVNCYSAMFSGCTSLESVPALPATTLAVNCYSSMFRGCTSLSILPKLKASKLVNGCYYNMFNDCTSIKLSENKKEGNYIEYRIPHRGNIISTGTNSLTDMFANTGGTFVGTPSVDTTYYLYTSEKNPEYLTFTAVEKKTSITFNALSGSDVNYSLDGGETWNPISIRDDGKIELKPNESVMFKGKDVITNKKYHFEMTGKIEASGDVTSLTNGSGGDVNLTAGCYSYMFYKCDSLITPPDLPSTKLAIECYKFMFNDCTSLETAPVLSATELAESCYSNMFNGCTSLETAPALPATTLAKKCYISMFYGCTSLTTIPTLNAEELKDGCYSSMFNKCESLRVYDSEKDNRKCIGTFNFPEFEDSFDKNPLNNMFAGTGGTFKETPTFNKDYYLYEGDYLTFTAVEEKSSITFNALSGSDVKYSLDGGETWNSISIRYDGEIELEPNESVMFKGKDVITNKKYHFEMTGKIRASGDVTSLTNGYGEDLDLTTDCYSYMFYECDSLITAPNLPSTKLAEGCYKFMFCGCEKLTNVPELPAEKLTGSCYSNMFKDCIALEAVPELPATTLATKCYISMFSGCKSLTTVDEELLPATTLTPSCYSFMFQNCTSLTTLPKLPATTLTEECYYKMFNGCKSIRLFTNNRIGEENLKEYRIPSTVNNVWQGTNSLTDMFANTGGTFVGTPSVDTTYYLYTSEKNPEYLTFTAIEVDSSVTFNALSGSDVKYSLDGGETWNPISEVEDRTIYLSANESVKFKGNNVKTDKDHHFSMDGEIKASGDVTTLTNEVGGDLDLTTDCYSYMFYECDSLITAPNLPSTKLAEGCYKFMFCGCEKLETTPTLPAVTLKDSCYSNMFNGCEKLTAVPNLPATTLARKCYISMFNGCKSLTTVDEDLLPLTNLADFCYSYMFKGCIALETVPNLPATTLAPGCYSYMFYGCESLETVPEDLLPATTMPTSKYFDDETGYATDGCYKFMFSGCTKLKTAPKLPATELSESCYSNMFKGCIALKTAPELSATTLAKKCYISMFSGCTALEEPPELKATDLAAGCYTSMLKDCLMKQTITFTDSKIDKSYGDSNFTRKVNGAKTKVKYSSTSTDVAEVDESTGEVTIKGVGNTTITAKATTTDTITGSYNAYESAIASYTINVSASINSDKSNVSVNGNKLSKIIIKEQLTDLVIDINDEYTNDCKAVLKDENGNIVIEDVTLSQGSIIATIPGSYFNSLSIGTHNFVLIVTNGNNKTYEYYLSIIIKDKKSSNYIEYRVVNTGVSK